MVPGMMVLIITMMIVEKPSMQDLQMSINMLNSSKDIVWYDFHFFPNELGIKVQYWPSPLLRSGGQPILHLNSSE